MMTEGNPVVYHSLGELNLRQISESGQCFRLKEYDKNKFIAVTGAHAVDIHDQRNACAFWCGPDEFRTVWAPYFDLDTDYEEFKARMQDDPFLRDALRQGGGIRILRQDLWETAVTFVISQNNSIRRITKSVEILCERFGTPLKEIGGRQIYAFPTAGRLLSADLSAASLGYREPYVRELCKYGDSVWRELPALSDGQAKKTLMAMRGIGEKVANCILLFGLHRMDSYPRDVWVNRLIDDVYHGGFDPGKYAGFAGYVQQLQFYHYRNRRLAH